MSRSPNAPKGRTAVLRVLQAAASATAIIAAGTMPAGAQVNITVSKADSAPADTRKLTLETAKPLPVPPRPDIRTPAPVKAAPRFVTPKVLEAPPPPDIVVGATPAPPPPVVGAPPAQTATKSEPAPAAATPAPAPKTEAAATETAALPPPAAPSAAQPAAPKSAPLSVVFDASVSSLPDAAESTLAEVAERMRANELLRLQLRSYASGTPETAREARQLSLARALAMRERLTAFGIRSTRIDVRALGLESGGGPADRIDIDYLNE
ncbi:OmpA family protein [Azospirillum soli]|uniref:OmpA family protein n=1 Tax=Azospirillum soli TaxID=1304799 RepID=UPI001FE64F19|nr:OmpA family protein [Azospirillum soli]MBP2310866.1 outer membrane protein OmpA-like peptidoglycan-associated protein [Azospirillum soli]